MNNSIFTFFITDVFQRLRAADNTSQVVPMPAAVRFADNLVNEIPTRDEANDDADDDDDDDDEDRVTVISGRSGGRRETAL